MISVALAVIAGLAVGVAFVIIFSTVGSSAIMSRGGSSSSTSECSGYVCKYYQSIVWTQITKDADCRNTNCALEAMLKCESLTSIALFGNGNNATIIRLYPAQEQPANGTTMCWIDVIKPDLDNYGRECAQCDYYVDLEMVNAFIGTAEMASWDVKNVEQLITRLTHDEPGNRFGGGRGSLSMSQFFSDELQ